jgi:hypothetical protein
LYDEGLPDQDGVALVVDDIPVAGISVFSPRAFHL